MFFLKCCSGNDMTVTTIWLLSSKKQKKPVCPVFSMVLQSFRKDEHSRKNRITLENTAFYQLMPENSDVSAPFGCENPKAVDATGLFGREGDFPPVPWLLFDYHFLTTTTQYAPVAQLDSACDSDSQGRRFESCRAYQNAVKSNDFTAFLYKLVKFSPLRHSSVGWGLFMDK